MYNQVMDEATRQSYLDNDWPLPDEHVQAYSTRPVGPDRCQHCKQLTPIDELNRNSDVCRKCRDELANY